MLQKWTHIVGLFVLTGLGLAGGTAQALPLSNSCSSGSAVKGVSVSDVTGNMGGASNCFGTFDGAHPGEGSELSYQGGIWSFLAKADISEDSQVARDANIGLYIT